MMPCSNLFDSRITQGSPIAHQSVDANKFDLESIDTTQSREPIVMVKVASKQSN